MSCRIADLRCKEVINICDGRRIGYVCDVEVDVECGKVVAVIVPGPLRFFFFGRGEDYIIPWSAIKRIGEDLILVEYESGPPARRQHDRRGWL